MTSKTTHLLQAFSNAIFAQYCAAVDKISTVSWSIAEPFIFSAVNYLFLMHFLYTSSAVIHLCRAVVGTTCLFQCPQQNNSSRESTCQPFSSVHPRLLCVLMLGCSPAAACRPYSLIGDVYTTELTTVVIYGSILCPFAIAVYYWRRPASAGVVRAC